MGPPEVEVAVKRYLRLADRLLPGRIVGFYLVGSIALGAFRPGRSDIDFVAVVDRDLDGSELRRLRALHLMAGGRSALSSARKGWSPMANTCNGVFVRAGDLGRPVSEIVPVASHSGRRFATGRGFDVNPAIWTELAGQGVTVRGPVPDSLGLEPQPELLRAWCLGNLSSYWEPWAEAVLAGRAYTGRFRPRWAVAWGTLGPPRLHHTIATGDVISKEAAGEYALQVFDGRWHPVIRQGLAYLRRQRADEAPAPTSTRTTAEFVLEVTRAAPAL